MHAAHDDGRLRALRHVRWPGLVRRGGGRRRATAMALGIALASALLSAELLMPQLHAVYRRPALHAALEAVASVIALLAAYLVFGRLRRQTRLSELMLTCGLAVLAVRNLFLVAVPPVVDLVPSDVTVRAELAGGLLGAMLFALAAWVPHRKLSRCRAMTAGLAGTFAAALLACAVVIAVTGPWPRDLAVGDLLPGSPAADLARVLQLLIAALFGVAVVGFWRRAQRLGDEFYRWVAVAGVLTCAAHLSYLPHPLAPPGVVTVGDLFRFAGFTILLAGSMREIRSYWLAVSDAAVLEERRRMARDLHDGVAQELAYLARNLHGLDWHVDLRTVDRLRRAVERAQRESLRAVSALTAPKQQAFDAALAEQVAEVADRCRIGLDMDLVVGVKLPPTRAEALVRIACEAITNAARHSGSDRVAVILDRDGPRVRLTVRDGGTGFDPEEASGGFGLVSMRERARSVGGEFRVVSAPGKGSEVEVAV